MAYDVNKLIQVATNEVGYLEKKSNKNLNDKTANAGSANWTKYGAYFGINPAAWCDMFFDWCMVQAYGREAAKKLLGGFSAYTPTSANYYKNMGRWSNTPQIGAQIFFKNSTRICHTGLVYKITSTTVYTIEGNTSGGSAVIANGGGVCKKQYSRSNSRIAGYGMPDYGATVQTATQTTNSAPIDGEIKSGGVTQDGTDKLGKVSYQAHLRGIGWAAWQCDGSMVGTTGQNRRIEALRIVPVGETDVVVHVRTDGDKEYKNITKDTILGTVNESKRIEAIKITGKETTYIYRVHQRNNGWTDWVVNGTWAGEKGKSLQIEAIEITAAKFLVNPHVQTYGWLGDKACQDVIGMTGKNLRLEAFKINPLNMGIEVKAHIQNVGWKDYGKITKDTVIGTVGEGKRIECLCFKGDFEYRVHIQNSGWTDWTKADGISTMGTVGEELRIEAIQFR